MEVHIWGVTKLSEPLEWYNREFREKWTGIFLDFFPPLRMISVHELMTGCNQVDVCVNIYISRKQINISTNNSITLCRAHAKCVK